MFSNNNKISIRQLQILLILDIFGTGIIFLPRIVTEYAKEDGWILVIFACLLAEISVLMITSLLKIFPNKNFFEICTLTVNKSIGVLFSFMFAIKIILTMAFNLRIFAEITRQTILPKTPFFITILSLLVVSGYVASKGFEARARLSEILIYLAIVPILIVFFIVATDVDYSNLLPVLKSTPENLLKGSYYSLFSFIGIDFCLLVMPYINNHKQIRKGILECVFLIGLLFLAITIITISRFGATETSNQLWPVLEMMDTIDIPGSFIERQEGLIFTFWIVSVFSISNAGIFFSSLLLKDTFKKGTHSNYIVICIPIIFLTSVFPKDLSTTISYLNIVNETLGICYLFIIPLFLLSIAKIRRLGVFLNDKK